MNILYKIIDEFEDPYDFIFEIYTYQLNKESFEKDLLLKSD